MVAVAYAGALERRGFVLDEDLCKEYRETVYLMEVVDNAVRCCITLGELVINSLRYVTR
jgi:two-component sensor histidine kinase